MAKKSMLEIAFEIMQDKKTISFSTLWSSIVKKLELTDEEANSKIGNFYTQLSLDGRFVALGNNKWSLRDRLKFDQIHVDTSDVYNDMEESEEDEEEEENTAETKKVDEAGNPEEDSNNI